LVIINISIPGKMHAPIPTESSSPGKPILPKLHRAEGNRRFKEHILILEEILFSWEIGTVGWDHVPDRAIVSTCFFPV
jgi:hypothetical protein